MFNFTLLLLLSSFHLSLHKKPNLSPDQQTENVPSKYYGILIIILQIILLVPLNRAVFGLPIFRHQQLALVMALLGIFLYIVKMFKDGGDYGMFYFLFGTVLNCIEIVIEKYLMEHKYITIYNLLFYEGVLNLV